MTAIDGLTVHRFVAIVQVDVAAPPDWSSADAEKWTREQLQPAGTDPGDEFQVVSITEVTR